MSGPTPFPDLNDVLSRLVEEARAILGSDFVGAYLTGSFALGDADEGSDVDFLIVTRAFLTENQQKAAQTLQRRLYDASDHWGKHLEGSYFPADLLRRPDPARTPVPYFDHGSRDMEFSDHDNTLVVRWVTRGHGIPLAGPAPQELIDPVDPDALRAEVRVRFERWGQAVLDGSERLDNDWIQPYTALSFARMLYSLETGAVLSKKAAVRWARDHLDPRWTPLLERAWAKHADQFLRYRNPADPKDMALTRDFLRFALSQMPHA